MAKYPGTVANKLRHSYGGRRYWEDGSPFDPQPTDDASANPDALPPNGRTVPDKALPPDIRNHRESFDKQRAREQRIADAEERERGGVETAGVNPKRQSGPHAKGKPINKQQKKRKPPADPHYHPPSKSQPISGDSGYV